MENKYLESLAYKFVLGQSTEEETQLLHLWYDAEWMKGIAIVSVNNQDNVYETGKRLFTKVKKAGGGK